MCGITALSRVSTRSSINDPRLFMRLAALAIEQRGKDATGFGWTNHDNQSWYWKKPVKARDAVALAPLDSTMKTVIGHTRWATQGDVKQNQNNHPVVDDGVLVVHNGVIDNDWELYEWLDKTFIPKAEVDSQIVATMLAHPDAFMAKHPTDLLGMIEGNAALAWLMTHTDPGALHLARLLGRPMTIGWTRRGDLVMSSTPETLAHTALTAGIRINKVREIEEGTYMRVVDGEIVEEVSFTPAVSKPKYKPYTFAKPTLIAPLAKPKAVVEDWREDGIYDKDGFLTIEGCRYFDALDDADDAELEAYMANGFKADIYDDEFTDEVDEFALVPATRQQIDWNNLVSRRGWKGHT